MEWKEITVTVKAQDVTVAEDIANMTVPYGIYTEDYTDLEQQALEIAHIDLIDEDLINKDRTKAIIHVYISDEDNAYEAVSFLKDQFSAVNIEAIVSMGSVDDSDWADNWKKFFKCTEIGEKLVIKPSWEEYENKSGRKVLNIDPGAAFGTGTHATTTLCLELLEQYIKPNDTMLDIGTGSGILSIASVLLGAKCGVGVDIDEVAVKVANENAALNGISDKLQFIKGDLAEKVNGKFNVVCANIVADVIIRLLENVDLFFEDNAVLICSGIINIRVEDVKVAFSKHGYKIIAERTKDNWYAFAVIKENN